MELLFAGAAPDLHVGRRLNRRHDNGPVQAISLHGATPRLNDGPLTLRLV